MNNFAQSHQAVIYVMDAYCGWCWGFAERIAALEAANKHRVTFTAISGGLFLGVHATAIGNYPYIAQANQEITAMTGAKFGQPYQDLLQEGSTVMNSLDAAMALAALRAQAPDRAIHWAHELQAAFYLRGLNLSQHATIADIANSNGLNGDLVLQHLADGSAQSQAIADFDLAVNQLQVKAYPSLFFIDGEQGHKLPTTGASLESLNEILDKLLA